jgi:hypothetical protein
MMILTSETCHRVEVMLPVQLDIGAIARARSIPKQGLLWEICEHADKPEGSADADSLKGRLLGNRQGLYELVASVGLDPSLSPNEAIPEWAEPTRGVSAKGKQIFAALRAAKSLIALDDHFYGHEPLLQDAEQLRELFDEMRQHSRLFFFADSLVYGRYGAKDVHDLSVSVTLFVAPSGMPELFDGSQRAMHPLRFSDLSEGFKRGCDLGRAKVRP